MLTTSDIRRHFLDYFARCDHTIVPSSSLVPRNDPTLLFTNAGMVQFKNIFTGTEKRPYVRAASSQKCVRAGGKHNDLERVGYTARHHTFFEMLGNFSFGDYFKEKAIYYAWNWLVNDCQIAPERLFITVYAEDEEAAKLWSKIANLPQERIIPISTSDNFWSMGDTGPCGPCSEIFYDHGEHIPGGPPGSKDEDGDRFVEIWNLVFMQYEMLPSEKGSPGKIIPLPQPSIDTGMSLERIAAVLQGAHDNYAIDLFQILIDASVAITGRPAVDAALVSHKVIADHLRAIGFLIADGIMPSNEGRGYVVRRIMRRAMRHGHILGYRQPLMWQLVPALVQTMGAAYPELVRAEALITDVLKVEEERFLQTLERGLRLLQDETAKLAPSQALPGEVAFRLYDTYGFPLDLTQDVLRQQDRTVEIKGFEDAMERQRAEARAHWVGSGEQKHERLWHDIHERIGATEFLGYSSTEGEGQIQALVVDDQEAPSAKTGDSLFIVANQTPFYAEAGGQMGDQGTISSPSGAIIAIEDTIKKPGDLHVHVGRIKAGEIAVGDALHFSVNKERRILLQANHSATHLLHAALRRLLGNSVVQKGSLVAPDRLRFDFSYTRPLTREQIRLIEKDVNTQIRGNYDVATHLMPPSMAEAKGAMALFGEKYGDEVRVVSMGDIVEEDTHKDYSIELCGGTHVHHTGDIGFFKIIAETGIAAGIRRIEALTGKAAEECAATYEELLLSASRLLKTNPEQLPSRIASVLEEKRRVEMTLRQAKLTQTQAQTGNAALQTQTIGDIAFACQILENIEAKELRGLADHLKTKIGSGVVAIVATYDNKCSVVVGVTSDLVPHVDAVELVKAAAQTLGGAGGGGRPDLAQAGGSDPQRAQEAIQVIVSLLQSYEKKHKIIEGKD